MELNSETPGLEPETALEPQAEVIQPEPQAEPAPAPEPAPAAPAAPAEPFWYRKELTAKEKRLKALERELEQVRSQAARPQQEPPPHILDDPEGFRDSVIGEIRASQEKFRIDQSEFFARSKHGDDMVDEVNDWLLTRPDMLEAARRTRDPWGSAITSYRREKLAAEIGDDPVAYRAKVEAELRASLAAEQQQSALATPQTGAPAPRIPTPASAQRSAAPRDPGGRFTGPAPLSEITKTKWT